MQQLKHRPQSPLTANTRPPSTGCWVDYLRQLPYSQARQILDEIARGDPEKLLKSWLLYARNEQYQPQGDWLVWLILAGRGFGKTRAGAELVREWVKTNEYVNLIGATSSDARDIMVEGDSGILACCTNAERPTYIANKGLLRWPNGAKSLIWTADAPERMRGKQSHALWMDELAAWRYPQSFDQAMLGLRLGKRPRAIVTTTPRPTKIIKDLIKSPMTIVTRGSTYDNKNNLAPQFIDQIIQKYEGSRLGRQELYAEVLDDNPNALFTRSNIDANRVNQAPDMVRVMVGIDPAVSNTESSNQTGIIVAGLGIDKRGYVLANYSMRATPEQWGRVAVNAYHQWGADRIIAEVNQGGDMVESVLRTIDRTIAYSPVHASRGKVIRAEPIAALYEQNRVSHVGSFNTLEDQMCEWDITMPADPLNSPDQMDALVWVLSKLMLKEPKPFIVA